MCKHLPIALLSLLLLFAGGRASAQKQRKAAAQKPAAENPGLKIYRSMIPNTAKVMFVDSMVVSKREFLALIPLVPDMGKLTATNGHVAYENGWGDMCIFAQGDTATTRLHQQARQGQTWGEKRLVLEDMEVDYLQQNYPFLCSDGVTLYFSAESEESMGGRDIFMTRYDTDEGRWYKPQNQGLPFNSTANEYLLAIDDIDSLGWLVTDRRQPADSVCIYTFVPTTTRRSFAEDDLDDKQIERYSRILSIRDSWAFGDRQAALARRDELIRRIKSAGNSQAQAMRFVVSDQRIVTDPGQFVSEQSRQLYTQLQEVATMQAQTGKELKLLRQQYAQTAATQRQALASKIRMLEKQQEQQEADMKQLAKQIRRAEH